MAYGNEFHFPPMKNKNILENIAHCSLYKVMQMLVLMAHKNIRYLAPFPLKTEQNNEQGLLMEML